MIKLKSPLGFSLTGLLIGFSLYTVNHIPINIPTPKKVIKCHLVESFFEDRFSERLADFLNDNKHKEIFQISYAHSYNDRYSEKYSALILYQEEI